MFYFNIAFQLCFLDITNIDKNCIKKSIKINFIKLIFDNVYKYQSGIVSTEYTINF